MLKKSMALGPITFALIFYVMIFTVRFRFSEEINAGFLYIFLAYLPQAVLIFLISFFLLLINKTRPIIFSLLACGIFLALLEGNIFINGLPVLDGNIQAYDDSTRKYVDCLIWAVILIGTLVFHNFFYQKRNIVITGLLIMSVAGLIDVYTGSAQDSSVSLGNTTRKEVINSLQYNKDNNVVILLLDGLGAEMADQILREHPELAEKMPGFINFTNNIGMNGGTNLAIPSILSGEYYDSGKVTKHRDKLFNQNSLITFFQNNGYNVYFSSIVAFMSNAKNVVPQESLNTSGAFLMSLGQLVKFQYIPYILKKNYLMKVFNPVEPEKKEKETYPLLGGMDLYERMSQAPITSDKPTFSFIHFSGGHSPYWMDQNCNPAEDRLNKDAYKDKSYCFLKGAAIFFDNMRNSGIYDNSTILIIADHSNHEFMDSNTSINLSTPMLMVKGKGYRKPYETVKEPSSSSNINMFLKKYVSSDFKMNADEIKQVLVQPIRRFVFHPEEESDLVNYYIDEHYRVEKEVIPSVGRKKSDLKPLKLNTEYDLNVVSSKCYPDFIGKNLSPGGLGGGGVGATLSSDSMLTFRIPKKNKEYTLSLYFLFWDSREIDNNNVNVKQGGIEYEFPLLDKATLIYSIPVKSDDGYVTLNINALNAKSDSIKLLTGFILTEKDDDFRKYIKRNFLYGLPAEVSDADQYSKYRFLSEKEMIYMHPGATKPLEVTFNVNQKLNTNIFAYIHKDVVKKGIGGDVIFRIYFDDKRYYEGNINRTNSEIIKLQGYASKLRFEVDSNGDPTLDWFYIDLEPSLENFNRVLFEKSLQVFNKGDKYGVFEQKNNILYMHPGATTPTEAVFDINKELDTNIYAYIHKDVVKKGIGGDVIFRIYLDDKLYYEGNVNRANSEIIKLQGYVGKLRFEVDSNGDPTLDWFYIDLEPSLENFNRVLFEKSLQVFNKGDKYGVFEQKNNILYMHPGATTPTEAVFDINKELDTNIYAYIHKDVVKKGIGGDVIFRIYFDDKPYYEGNINRTNSEIIKLQGYVGKLRFQVDSNGDPTLDWFYINLEP